MSCRPLCVFLLFLTSSMGFADGRPLIFVGDENYPPMSYWYDGRPAGVFVDLAIAVGTALGEPYFPTLSDWVRAQSDVQVGQADVLFGLSYSEGRAQTYDLTDPLWHNDFTFFSRGHPEITQLQDLHGAPVGVTAGGLPRQLIATIPGARVVVFQSYQDAFDAFDALEAGRITAFAGDRWVGSYLLSQGPWPGIGPATENFASLPAGMAVRKGNQALLDRLNTVIRQEEARGTFAAIAARWQPKAVVFFTQDQVLWFVVSGLGLVLVAVLAWVVFLLREIRLRRAAEHQLFRVTTAVEQARWGMAITNGGLLALVNPAYAQMHGYRPEELIGQSSKMLIAPESAEAYQEFVPERNPSQSAAAEFTRLRKDGSTFPALVSWTILEAVPGFERSVVVTVQDISEQKGFQRTIAEQSAQLRSLLNTLPDLVWLKDREGVYLAGNRRFEALVGLVETHIIGKTDGEFFSPEVAARYRAEDLHVLESGEMAISEGLRRFADGHEEYLEIVKAPVYDAAGRGLGILGLGRDITRRKADYEAVKRSESKFLKVFHSSPNSIVIYDLDTRVILEVNEGFLRQTGFERAEVIGRTSLDLGTVIRDDRLQEYRQRVSLAQSLAGFEMQFRMKSGERRTYLVYSEPFDLDGRACRLDYHVDITDLKKAEEEKWHLQAHLNRAQRIEGLGILAGGIAHDMNNVLGAILGMASAGLQVVPEGPIQQAFDVISKAAERGGASVKALLGFARQSPAETLLLDVNALIREEVSLLERTILAHTQVTLDLADELPPVRGDDSAVLNALMNLISNGVDAMDGTGSLVLRTRDLEDGRIEIQVTDTGSGMPPEVLEKALEPFFTTKPIGKGTGLGLALVYATVQAHQGHLDIRSTVGKGTTVSVILPATIEARSKPPSPAPVASQAVTLEVLLVDDDELVRQTIGAILSSLGHRVTAASSGEEALSAVKGGAKPDLVVLDMTMPGLGGVGTLPKLREILPEVPVILATGLVNQAALDLVAQFSRVSLLAKPFRVDELKAAILGFDPEGRAAQPLEGEKR